MLNILDVTEKHKQAIISQKEQKQSIEFISKIIYYVPVIEMSKHLHKSLSKIDLIKAFCLNCYIIVHF